MKIPLLDLGNVVVQFQWRPFFDAIGAESNDNSQGNPYDKYLKSSLFSEFEFGMIGRREFYERSQNILGKTIPEDDFFNAFCSIFSGWTPGMQKLLEDLSAKGPVYCLSNTNEVHFNHLLEEMPGLKSFTRVFASHELKRRKPYPGIYREVCKLLECGPRELVFFDDVEANVHGARRAGLSAHLFVDSEQIRQQLSIGAE